MGTAALVNLCADHDGPDAQKILTCSLDRTQFDKQDHKKVLHVDVNLANQAAKIEHGLSNR